MACKGLSQRRVVCATPPNRDTFRPIIKLESDWHYRVKVNEERRTKAFDEVGS